jgi:DNA-binding transcriptional MerR regulator
MRNLAKMPEFKFDLNLEDSDNSNFKTIGEVSGELDIPPHVLRFWESKFNDIKPHKRKGGHRYYNKENVDLIKKIKTLLYKEGFTIKGAQKYLREQKNSHEDSISTNGKSEAGQQNLFIEQLSDNIKKHANDSEVQSGLDQKTLNVILDELESVKKILQE